MDCGAPGVLPGRTADANLGLNGLCEATVAAKRRLCEAAPSLPMARPDQPSASSLLKDGYPRRSRSVEQREEALRASVK